MSDDWDENTRGPRSPLVVVLSGCVLMVTAALAAPMFLGHQPLLPLIAGGAAAGLLLWLVAWAVAMRGAGAAWIFGSLVLMLGIGATAGLSIHVRDQGGVRQDLGTIAEMEIAPNGSIAFPRGAAARGPLSKLLVEAAAAEAAERKAFADALGKLGLGNLNSSYNLAKDPAVLGRCGEIAGLKSHAAEARRKRQERVERVAKVAETMAQPPEIVAAIRATMAPADDPAALDALERIAGEGLDAAAAQCAVLARRGWSDQTGYFGWASGADAAAYRETADRKVKSASDQGAIDREARARAIAAQEVIRTFLAKS
jgi:hypothetical protein